MEIAKSEESAVTRHDGSKITIDSKRLKPMSAKELHDFRDVIHTLSDVLCGLSGTGRFYVNDDDPIPRYNPAGDFLDDILNWLGALEDAGIEVGRAMKPKTAKEIEWRCWMLARFEADMTGDLTDLVAIVGQGVKDVADASREESRVKREEEHPLPEPPQNRVTLQ